MNWNKLFVPGVAAAMVAFTALAYSLSKGYDKEHLHTTDYDWGGLVETHTPVEHPDGQISFSEIYSSGEDLLELSTPQQRTVFGGQNLDSALEQITIWPNSPEGKLRNYLADTTGESDSPFVDGPISDAQFAAFRDYWQTLNTARDSSLAQ